MNHYDQDKDLLLVETHPVHQNNNVLQIYRPKLWLILFSCLTCNILLFENHGFGEAFQILHPNCSLVVFSKVC